MPSHLPTPSKVSCCSFGIVPSAFGERLRSSVPFLLTISTSVAMIEPGPDTRMSLVYPHVEPILLSTCHTPVRMPGGMRPSKSRTEPMVVMFVPDGAKAAFLVLMETSLPHCFARL